MEERGSCTDLQTRARVSMDDACTYVWIERVKQTREDIRGTSDQECCGKRA